MIRNLTRALLAVVILAVLTGLAFPLALTGIGQVFFNKTANGSIIDRNGRPIGSAHIGQKWEGPEWFYGRPSAVEYDASTSSGSNLGPTSQKLADQIKERAQAILTLEGRYVHGLTTAAIPPDLLLASGSGLDPDISPQAARFQAPRIAAVRHMDLAAVLKIISDNTHEPPFRLFGAPHVNVLQLDLAISQAS